MLQPDLLFGSQKRSRIIQERIVGAPDMILEVLSPNPRIGLLEQRLELFAEYGVREIWLLHQIAKRFELRRTVDGRPVRRYAVDYQTPLTSDVLPDFHMCVGDILQD